MAWLGGFTTRPDDVVPELEPAPSREKNRGAIRSVPPTTREPARSDPVDRGTELADGRENRGPVDSDEAEGAELPPVEGSDRTDGEDDPPGDGDERNVGKLRPLSAMLPRENDGAADRTGALGAALRAAPPDEIDGRGAENVLGDGALLRDGAL